MENVATLHSMLSECPLRRTLLHLDAEFVELILSNPDVLESLDRYVAGFENFSRSNSSPNVYLKAANNTDVFNELVEWALLGKALMGSAGLEAYELPATSDRTTYAERLSHYFSDLLTRARQHVFVTRTEAFTTSASERIDAFKPTGVRYSISEDQLDTVQERINEIRAILSKADGIAEHHRERLLKRLEALQKELHKTMPSMDRFFGTVLEVSAFAARLSEDGARIAHNCHDMFFIGLNKITTAAGLPPGGLSSLLPPAESPETAKGASE